MINVGSADFHIAVPSLPKTELEAYSTRLFDEWEAYVGQILSLPDYSLVLEVEEGSVKGLARVGAALGAIYFGIGAYGSFIAGLQTIRGQINDVAKFVGERAKAPLDSTGQNTTIHRSGGALGQLQRLFVRVQKGELTPEQATQEARALFGEDSEHVPEFMQRVSDAFEQMPRLPEQSLLPFDGMDVEAVLPEGPKERIPRKSPSAPYLPATTQFRVEVWRESKNGARRVRVTEL